MAVDVRQLSPKAQAQVLKKLQESYNVSHETKNARSDSKYGNRKVEVGGITFDSKREARRYLELKAMEAAGEISELRLQVKYLLIPSQRIDGKVVEREVAYVADFTYYDKGGNLVVEDTKGHRTKDYIIKRKLVLWVHGIRIVEV